MKQETEVSRKELALELSAHVSKACQFGSSNTGNSLEATRELLKFRKAVTVMFNTLKDAVIKKLSGFLSVQELKIIEDFINNFLKDGTKGPYSRKQNNDIVRLGTYLINLQPHDYLSLELLKIVNFVYPLATKFNFHGLQKSDFYPVIGMELSERFAYGHVQKQGNAFFYKKVAEEMEYLAHYEHGCFSTKAEKSLFINVTASQVKTNVYFHAVANCALMADAACLEAIVKPHNFDIHYVRFFCKDATVEELNTIVLGDWPTAGCVITAPWLPAENREIEWAGSIENTPQICDLKYDTFKTVVHITPAEKAAFHKTLTSMSYENWLTSPVRAKRLTVIKEYTDKFLDNINEVILESQNQDSQLKQ